METRLLDASTVLDLADLPGIVAAVEDAFAAYHRGTVVMPPKTYVDLPAYDGDFRAMPAYVDTGDWDAAGLKWVNVHTANPTKHDLPTVLGTMIYSDPETALPLAILDGRTLTGLRTGAAAAVATDHLAIPDATSLGLVGAGAQAHTQLEAISSVRPIETVVVADANHDRAKAFVDTHGDTLDASVGSVAAAGHCDVCSTITPVEDPILGLEDVGESTHVNAIGADAPGKRELTDAVLAEATLVIDDHEQCTHSGEINVPYQAGRLTDEDIAATLGAVVAGDHPGRRAADGVTVFDSTGLAIQDVAAARVIYRAARAADAGVGFDLHGLG